MQVLTENQIESIVERQINKLDAQLMSGKLTQSEYDHEVMIVDKWASQQHEHLKDYA
jgi:hypothetical protein